MKRINFEYRVSTNVLINRVDILAIQKVGRSHYDGKCKDFANKRCAYWLMDWEESEPSREITINSDEFDTVAKILEQEHYHGVKLYDEWVYLFQQQIWESERVNAHWMIAENTMYTARYKDNLRAKYGDGHAVIPFTETAKGV